MIEAARSEPPVVPVDSHFRDAIIAGKVTAPPLSTDATVAVVEVPSGHDIGTPAAPPRVFH